LLFNVRGHVARTDWRTRSGSLLLRIGVAHPDFRAELKHGAARVRHYVV
jgi:hypothetical protein